jgi:hypothetical protein
VRRSALAAAAGFMAVAAATTTPAARGPVQSDLDQFMAKVLARRDENWKKLQQYILDERTEFALRGPTGIPVWGDRREFTWFIREGRFIRSPLKANGVEISETERREYEDKFLRRVQAREKRDAERRKDDAAAPGTPTAQADLSGRAGAPAQTQTQAEAPTLDAFLSQTREPEFINSAYFMNFKFEDGRYALVGREPFQGTKEVLRIEYYPKQLFGIDPSDERRKRNEKAGRDDRSTAYGEALERMMNKVALVTLWIEPASLQIVRYTFDNVNFDFLPAAWLLRVDELKASMTMSQPFKDKPDIWLPQQVHFSFLAMFATGPLTARFDVEYHDYREATTAGRIKKAGLR